MKTPYEVTEADRQTGRNLRKLRRRHGESMAETIAAAGLKMSVTTISNTELGRRALTLPEATKLAAHFGTTVDKLTAQPVEQVLARYQTGPAYTEAELAAINAPTRNTISPAVPTEQAWLGNEPSHPPLFLVEPKPEPLPNLEALPAERYIRISRDNPLTPDEYREQVWVPYLEARYSSDKKAS